MYHVLNKKLPRAGASEFLIERYGPAATSRMSLAHMARSGIGPKHVKFGIYPVYETDDLIAWAESQIKPMKKLGRGK